MGDFEQAALADSAIAGCNRFLTAGPERQAGGGEGYRPQIETPDAPDHQEGAGADIETLKMNTAIAQLMTLVNALYDNAVPPRLS